MKLLPIQFSDIDYVDKQAIASWAPLIAADVFCKIAEYAKCEDIDLNNLNYSTPIGFVLSGKIEIYESYEFLEMTAYRPIRLLSQGDVIGDFSFLDAKLGCSGPTRRGESWRIQAGARSVQRIHPDNEPVITDGGTSKPHLILPLILQEGARVLFIDGAQFGENETDLVDRLLRYSWVRAKIYRDSLNSFNFNELLLFKEKAYRIHDDLLNKRRDGGGRQYAKAVSKDAILDVFLDAVWDACNRPLRNEPLFLAQSGESLSPNEASALSMTGIKPENIHLASASWATESRLLFPVGSHNFLIGAYAQAALDNPAKKRRDSIRRNINRIFHRQNKQRDANEKPVNEFYLDLANIMIAENIVPKYSNYPYRVVCKEIQGTYSKIMVLEFASKESTLDG